ncbi:MAG TPA: transglycosylase domain-containing protein [Candidatus Dormibacteraeota bacterium]|nr:transglycosylase domain-containing protein [Candidatus Dormibacteraeota bacterium]
MPRRRRSRYAFYRRLRLLRESQRRTKFRRALLLCLVVAIGLPVLTVPALAAESVGSLPAVEGLTSTGLNQDMLIFDRHGTLIDDIGYHGDHRIVVPLKYISPYAKQASIAIEDRSFYQNNGVDVGGIVRAAVADYSQHHITQGGSTISQQLVKQLFIGPHPAPTIQRKLKEAILAMDLNRRYTKDQILELYLNTIYYGSQSYGVEAAARAFFHTNAHDLTLAQAAMLAGLPQAPTQNSPVINLTTAKQRQAEVLNAMVAQKMITRTQAISAEQEQLQYFYPTNALQAPHFVDYVLSVLDKQFHIRPSNRKGYRVYTTLDLNLQHIAEQVVHNQIATHGNFYDFHDAALVSMDPKTGQVLAMVGGDDYYRPGGQINMATTDTRQPGSSFKMFTYTAAIESGKLNVTSPVLDQPMVFPLGGGPLGDKPWAPLNYDKKFHGTVPLKMAMGNSLNIPAVKVELVTGIGAVLDVARRMGVTSLTKPDGDYGKSLTLGGYGVSPIDMVTGASTLATLGVRHRPAPVLHIQDGLGNTKFDYDPAKNEFRAVSQQVAFIIDSIMSDDRNRCMEFGCGGDLTLPGRHVGAKTGTTQDFRDNWTVGFTPSLATAVWVGNPDYHPLAHNSTGIVGAAPIWHQFMMQALAQHPDEWYAKPDGVDAVGGNYYLPGTEAAPAVLASSWPVCRFRNYNPYTLTDAQLTVNGLPCILGYTPAGLQAGTSG